MTPTRPGEKGNEPVVGDRDAGANRGQAATAFERDGSRAIDPETTEPVTDSPSSPPGVPDDAPESQPLMRHHPVIGYQFNPGTRHTMTRPDGGTYQLSINAAGIRSDREYALAKPPDVYRILVFGDSQADGYYQPNERRFTELIERRNPGIEVVNFALRGSGTDQQLLVFEEIGRNYEHDLVILLPFAENIRRIMPWALPCVQPQNGRIVYRLKPRFVLTTRADGTEVLELHNIPIPEEPVEAEADNPVDRAAEPNRVGRITRGLRRAGGKLPTVRLVKKFIYPLLDLTGCDPFPLLGRLGYDPLPEYETADTEEWRLMAAIIRRFAKGTEPKPFVVAPIVNSSYMRFAVGRNYWHRFHSLADGERVHVIDLLPHFLQLGRRAVDCYMEPHDSHLSDLGHSVLADAIEAELRRLGLLPVRNSEPRAVDRPEKDGASEGRDSTYP
jgi:hypothetical protein